MLNVTLLGGISFSANGSIVKSDLGPAGRLLACYLFAFSRRAHRRERLADLFWGEAAPDKARAALNTAIWRIRKILELGSEGDGQQLITLGDDVILEPSPFLAVDTHRLESASRRLLGKFRDLPPGDPDMLDVRAAVEAYGGPFLDGYDGEWIIQERERLHCLFVRTTFELMRMAAVQGRYEDALHFGRQILAADPLREDIQRSVMLLLVLNGQRVDAIRTYQRLVSLLRSELDIGPMPETKRLHNHIVSEEIFMLIDQYSHATFGDAQAQRKWS
jgi:DNA-binding SARP family transcriptional activator